jgi:putative flippase GtrA/transposase-like protein
MTTMDSRPRTRLSFEARCEIVTTVREGGLSANEAAAAFGVHRSTVYRLLGRFAVGGWEDLRDRPSTPARQPRRLPVEADGVDEERPAAIEAPLELDPSLATRVWRQLRTSVAFCLGLLNLHGVAFRFAGFCLVGAIGIAINTALFAAGTDWLGLPYAAAGFVGVQGATLWNYLFLDAWVFSGRAYARPRFARVCSFFIVTNAAIAVSAPVLFGLSNLGVTHFRASVLSVGTLTVVRFVVADRWIWGAAGDHSGGRSAERASQDLKKSARREADVIVTEANAEARKVLPDAITKKEQVMGDMRRVQAVLRSALAVVEKTPADAGDEEAEKAPAASFSSSHLPARVRGFRWRTPSVFGRRWAAAGLVATASLAFWATALSVPSWASSERKATASVAPPPTLEELDRSLAWADNYLSGLYKSVGPTSAVMSEYYGLPLRVYLPRYNRWLLAGRDRMAVVDSSDNLFDSERSSIDFRSPRAKHSPELEVILDWNASPNHYTITLVNRGFEDLQTSAHVYLGGVFLGRFSSQNVGQSLTRTFAKDALGQLQSFRYTVRHGSQLGQNYFAYRSELQKSTLLTNVIRGAGFALNYDTTAPIWAKGETYPDGMLYDGGSGGLNAYHDCRATLPSSTMSYPYRSKVCVASSVYVWLSHLDTLAPAEQAIHVLNKYENPETTIRNRRFPLGLPVGWSPTASIPNAETPLSIARDLEAKFRQLGFGIPTCVSASYCSTDASAIRTFQFGALETLLAYRFGQNVSRSYADAIARIALAVQVHDDGLIRSEHGSYYRPATIGSFYLKWDSADRLSFPHPGASQSLIGLLYKNFDMPAEYGGIIPSNAESTLTAYAFLVLYRCERYRVGCERRSAERQVLAASGEAAHKTGGAW